MIYICRYTRGDCLFNTTNLSVSRLLKFLKLSITLINVSVCFWVLTLMCIKHGMWMSFIPSTPVYKKSMHSKIKKIVLWTARFGDTTWGIIPKRETDVLIKCPKKCLISRNKTSELDYDALVFSATDLHQPLPKNRRSNQVYIMQLHESPVYRGGYGYIKKRNFYNWTATYRPMSDVYMPFWYVVQKKATLNFGEITSKLPQMTIKRNTGDAMILWIASHCTTSSKREKYVKML